MMYYFLLIATIGAYEYRQVLEGMTSQFEDLRSVIAESAQSIHNILDIDSQGFRTMLDNYGKYGVFYADTSEEPELPPLRRMNYEPRFKRQLLEGDAPAEAVNTTAETNPLDNSTQPNISDYRQQWPLYGQSCLNNGKNILTKSAYFYCNGTRVTWFTYNLTRGAQPNGTYLYTETATNCETVNQFSYLCLCPKDYYGQTCESWNPIVCDINKTDTTTCPTFYSNYYNSNLDGDAPCISVAQDTVHYQMFDVICYNKRQSMLNESISANYPFETIWSNYTEGISKLQPDVYQFYYPPPNPDSDFLSQQKAFLENKVEINETEVYKYSPIEYYYDFGGFLSSSYDFVMYPRTIFLNWKNINASYEIEDEIALSINELSAGKQVTQVFDFSLIFKQNVSAFGRFQYQTDILIDYKKGNQTTTYIASNSGKFGYFEDSTYEEPLSTTALSRTVVIGIIVLICLVVAALGCTIRHIKKQIDKRKVNLLLREQQQRILAQNENLG